MMINSILKFWGFPEAIIYTKYIINVINNAGTNKISKSKIYIFLEAPITPQTYNSKLLNA
jgi:hypothetical protein